MEQRVRLPDLGYFLCWTHAENMGQMGRNAVFPISIQENVQSCPNVPQSSLDEAAIREKQAIGTQEYKLRGFEASEAKTKSNSKTLLPIPRI
jgi:hypothetical protein